MQRPVMLVSHNKSNRGVPLACDVGHSGQLERATGPDGLREISVHSHKGSHFFVRLSAFGRVPRGVKVVKGARLVDGLRYWP